MLIENQVEKTIKIKKLDVLNERRRGLRPATSLFNYYQDHTDELNRVKIQKIELAAVLNVSERTISNWVRALASVGLIKYKYSGAARLNPEFWFVGSQTNYEKALEEYKRFKSDI